MKKLQSFELDLEKVDFWVNAVDLQSSEPLTEQTCNARLEIWHENP